jgi:hypothetical protein
VLCTCSAIEDIPFHGYHVSALLAPRIFLDLVVENVQAVFCILWVTVLCSKHSWLRVFLHVPSSLLQCLWLEAALTHLFLLASLMPSLLTAMKSTSELVHSEVCLLSALAALHKVVETLPHFISPYLEGLLTQVGLVIVTCCSGWPGGQFHPSVILLARSSYDSLCDSCFQTEVCVC